MPLADRLPANDNDNYDEAQRLVDMHGDSTLSIVNALLDEAFFANDQAGYAYGTQLAAAVLALIRPIRGLR